MRTSQNGINLIKSFEGCRLQAYKAVKTETYYTIGYGHYGKDVKKDQTITLVQAEELLKKDLVVYETKVNAYNKIYNFNQNEFDALVSFTYNCGASNLDKLTANGTRTKEKIGNVLILYNKSGGKVLNGLVKRREKEKELYFSPVDSTQKLRKVANEVIAGKYGNGAERRLKLKILGYNPDEVQVLVNRILKGE